MCKKNIIYNTIEILLFLTKRLKIILCSLGNSVRKFIKENLRIKFDRCQIISHKCVTSSKYIVSF